MKRLLVLLPFAALLPAAAQAADVRVNVGIGTPAVVAPVYAFGDRDKRGYYWDGKTWRDPVYWEKNHGKGKGNQGCPPGQAKKGNC